MEGFAIDTLTVNQRAYVKLRQLIVSGSIALGTRLDERDLAAKMGISRTPLREAIGKLVKEGVIEHRPYQGNFVRTFDAKQVSGLYEARKALEVLAIRLAVRRLSESDITMLAEILEDVDRALDESDLERFGEADRRFHASIARLSDNETLVDLLDRLDLQVQIVRSIANRDPDVVERTTGERKRVLTALRSRHEDAAAKFMEAHIEGVRNSVVRQFEELQSNAEPLQGA
jgi:DNA-binding GntR family transcriptional regulator